MAATRDVVVVGGGHNGLVAAFYLAKAGFKPLVLERRPIVGGCAITEEFHPGFRCSRLAHCAGPIRSDIVGDMDLVKHGLKTYSPDVRVLSLSPSGKPLFCTATSQTLSRRLRSSRRKMRRITLNLRNRWVASAKSLTCCWR